MFGRFSSFFGRKAFRSFSTQAESLNGFVKNKNKMMKLGLFGLVSSATALTFFAYHRREANAAAGSAFNPKDWKKFYVKEVQEVNHNTKILTFGLETPETPLGLPVASCILTRAPIGENGTDVIRPYTPISPANSVGHFELLVKKYPQGVMSKHLHGLKPGDFVEIKGPLSKIPYKPNMVEEIGMIAGGTGITPMFQVLNEILSNPQDKTKVSLVFANIAEEDILLREQLDSFSKKHSNFQVYYVLEKPPAKWNQGVGYVTQEILEKYLPKPSDKSLVLVCGPPPMMKAISGNKNPDFTQGEVEGILKAMHFEKSQVFKF